VGNVDFIDHKGKKILFVNFAGLDAGEITPRIIEAQGIIMSQPPNSLLCLTDVSRMSISKAVIQLLKEYVAQNKPYIKRSVVVGVSGITNVLFQGVLKFSGRTDLVLKSSVEEAKDWLVLED